MSKASWADRVDFEQDGLPLPGERIDGDLKIVTDYKEVDGRKYKVTRTYKMERKQVPKAIAHRKSLAKFGDSKHDKPGPQPATTMVAEEIFMQFISIKGGVEENQETEEDLKAQVKSQLNKTIICRICKEEHWTTQCPMKDRMSSTVQLDEGSRAAAAAANAASKGIDPNKVERYVNPALRDGYARKGEAMPDVRKSREENTIRVTNLSEDIKDRDLNELFAPFGKINRIYLARDKVTNQPRGYAFISFQHRDDALRAVASVDGHGYDSLILSVDMANK